jgi:hypothetical protein
MSACLCRWVADSPSGAFTSALRAVGIYGDVRALAGMHWVCSHWVKKFSRSLKFDCEWFGLDELQNAYLAQNAVAAAADACLILFPDKTDAELVPTIRSWVEIWLAQMSPGRSALVVLVRRNGGVRSREISIRDYLHDVARCAGLDFFTISPSLEAVSKQPGPVFEREENVYLNPPEFLPEPAGEYLVGAYGRT